MTDWGQGFDGFCNASYSGLEPDDFRKLFENVWPDQSTRCEVEAESSHDRCPKEASHRFVDEDGEFVAKVCLGHGEEFARHFRFSAFELRKIDE